MTRTVAPTCLGERMLEGSRNNYYLQLRQLGYSIQVWRADPEYHWQWAAKVLGESFAAGFVKGGPQAAANAAEREIVKRAELTLKLAGRRAA